MRANRQAHVELVAVDPVVVVGVARADLKGMELGRIRGFGTGVQDVYLYIYIYIYIYMNVCICI